MSAHGLTHIVLGVPDVAAVAGYYTEFGLTPSPENGENGSGVRAFRTVDGGEQLRLTTAPRRRLLQLGVGVDDTDDLARIAASLDRLGLPTRSGDGALAVTDPGTGVEVVCSVAARVAPRAVAAVATNGPGRADRPDTRADGVLREQPVRPRKLGHVVLGSTDQPASERFFTEGLGFRVSDTVPGLAAFLRCSTDHHNVLVQQAPLAFLHHTSWQVDDVDEVGRGATAMLAADPDRHVWGLGRHHVGSNFFWYLKDPAGNFSEYYSDLDCILDDQLWTPGVWEGARGLYSWGPPPPPSFLAPDDLAELMAGAHA